MRDWLFVTFPYRNDEGDDEVLIQVAHIVAIHPWDDTRTRIATVDGSCYVVELTLAGVVDLLNSAVERLDI